MKKRVFSLLLALALCLSMLPTAALAETENAAVQDAQTGENNADVYIEGEDLSDGGFGGDAAAQSAGEGATVQAATHANHPICGAEHKDIGDHTGTCPAVAWTELTVQDGKLYIGNTEAKLSDYSTDSHYSNY